MATRMTRRDLLAHAARGSVVLAMGSAAPGLFGAPLLADEASEPGGAATSTGGRTLVVIELAGGNDGLNTVVPTTSDAYRRARPTLALPARECLRLTDDIALHPALGGLRELWDDGLLGIVHGVGYPSPDRSHFRSMEIWHTARPASPAGRERAGWLGRAVDASAAAARARSAAAARLPAVALLPERPLALGAPETIVPALRDPRELRLGGAGAEGQALRALLAGTCEGGAAAASARAPSPASAASAAATAARAGAASAAGATGAPLDPRDPLATARAATRSALAVADDLARLADEDRPQVAYPDTALAAALRAAARLLAGRLGTRVIYVGQGGFDTHAAQAGQHARLLGDVGGAVRAFVRDLEARKLDREVLVLAFSEFGRRVDENASAGTDHGAAGPVLLAGPGVRPGLHGRHPPLERLVRGDLEHTCDFREVYATALGWLGLGGQREAILGAPFAALPVLR